MLTVLLIGGIWMMAAVALAALHCLWRASGGHYAPASNPAGNDDFVIEATKASRQAA